MNNNNTAKILFVGVNPLPDDLLQLTKEYKRIDDELQAAKLSEHFDLDPRWELELTELPSAIMNEKPRLVHFSGHGSENGELCFRGRRGEPPALANPKILARLFGLIGGRIRCVLLNACHSEEQAKLIAEHVDAVIGMADEIEDGAAIQFSSAFYQALGTGANVALAFDLALWRLENLENGAEEVPKLVTRDGRDPTEVFLHDIDRPATSWRGAQATITFIGVSPNDLAELDLTTEVKAIRGRLERTRLKAAFEFEQAWGLSPAQLPKAIMRHRPKVLQFSGHGESGKLLFEDEDGESIEASPTIIAELFEHVEGIRCVVLNACHSAKQADAIAEHVDTVIGMSDEILDTSAIQFSSAFYEALGYGSSVKQAFELAKIGVGLAGGDESGEDRRIPRLYVKDGVDASKVFIHEPAP